MINFASITFDSVPVVVAFLTGVVGPVILLYVKHFLNSRKEAERSRKKQKKSSS